MILLNLNPYECKMQRKYIVVKYFYVARVVHSQNRTTNVESISTNRNTMMQRTANENAASSQGICKRSDQPKIERLENNGKATIHYVESLTGQRHDRVQTESQPWTAVSTLLSLVSTV